MCGYEEEVQGQRHVLGEHDQPQTLNPKSSTLARANKVKFRENLECIPPAHRTFLSPHGLPRSALRDKKIEDQCVNWQFVKSEMDELVEMTSVHGKIGVDMFTDGKGMVDGKSMRPVYYSITYYAFKYPCIGTSFYGNPSYNADLL